MRQNDSDIDYLNNPSGREQQVVEIVAKTWLAWPAAPGARLRTGYSLDLWWPTLILIAIVAGAFCAKQSNFDRVQMICATLFDAVQRQSVPDNSSYILVVSTSPDRQMQIAATVTPRGFSPLFARNLGEVSRNIAAHPASLKMAVVDESMNSAALQQAIATAVPPEGIVNLPGAVTREAVAQTLLDRVQRY